MALNKSTLLWCGGIFGAGCCAAGGIVHAYPYGPYTYDPVKSMGDQTQLLTDWEKLMLNDEKSGASDSPDYQTWRQDPDFSLRSLRCARAFFPGATLPETHTIDRNYDIPNDNVIQKDQKNTLMVKPSTEGKSDVQWGTTMSCTMMHLRHRRRQFLFRTETAMRNLHVGIVHWMGVKTVDAKWDKSAQPHVYIVQFMAFLEKVSEKNYWSEEVWEVKGGYGWRDIVTKDRVKEIKIVSPDAVYENNVLKNSPAISFSGTQLNSDAPLQDLFYAGMWRESADGKNMGMGLSETKHTKVNGGLNIDPVTPRGYTDVDVFFHKSSKTGFWKRFKNHEWKDEGKNDAKTYHFTINGKEVVEAWYKPFRNAPTTQGQNGPPKKGYWTPMDRYCEEGNFSYRQHVLVNNPCFR